jgi:phosphomannomutase
MQNHIFRKFDIRGVIGIDLTMQDIQRLAQTIVAWFEKQEISLQRIAVGLDGRVHGPEISQVVQKAIVDAGYQVYFLGMCPTPMFEYGLHQLPVQAGIMITASGSAAEFNGFKLYLHSTLVKNEQLQEIAQNFEQGTIKNSDRFGKIIPCPISDQYLDALWQEFAHLSQYDFSIMIDCSHATTGPVMKKLVEKMGWKQVSLMYDLVDGAFPIHDPEPADSKNLASLQKAIKKQKKLFGVMFDGDGDRLAICNNDGTVVRNDHLFAIFAQDMMSRYKKRTMLCEALTFDYLSTLCMQTETKIVPVGPQYADMLDAIAKHQAILASQTHGRFFFKDRHAGFADGIYAFLRLLDILVRERKNLHELLHALHTYHIPAPLEPQIIKEL